MKNIPVITEAEHRSREHDCRPVNEVIREWADGLGAIALAVRTLTAFLRSLDLDIEDQEQIYQAGSMSRLISHLHEQIYVAAGNFPDNLYFDLPNSFKLYQILQTESPAALYQNPEANAEANAEATAED